MVGSNGSNDISKFKMSNSCTLVFRGFFFHFDVFRMSSLQGSREYNNDTSILFEKAGRPRLLITQYPMSLAFRKFHQNFREMKWKLNEILILIDIFQIFSVSMSSYGQYFGKSTYNFECLKMSIIRRNTKERKHISSSTNSSWDSLNSKDVSNSIEEVTSNPRGKKYSKFFRLPLSVSTVQYTSTV